MPQIGNPNFNFMTLRKRLNSDCCCCCSHILCGCCYCFSYCHLAQKAALSTDCHKKQTSFQLFQSNKTATYPTFTPPPFHHPSTSPLWLRLYLHLQATALSTGCTERASESELERERERDGQPTPTLEHRKICCILCIVSFVGDVLGCSPIV